MQTLKISFEQTLSWGLDLQKAQEPMLGGVECGRDMTVLPGEWPSWSREFGTLASSGTFISVCPHSSCPTALGSEIAFSAQHLHCPQGGQAVSASVWIYRSQLTLSLLELLFRVAPKVLFCLCFFPHQNVPLQVSPSAVHTFHRFSWIDQECIYILRNLFSHCGKKIFFFINKILTSMELTSLQVDFLKVKLMLVKWWMLTFTENFIPEQARTNALYVRRRLESR